MQMIDNLFSNGKIIFLFSIKSNKFHMSEMNSKDKYTKNELVILDLSNANFKMYICLWVYVCLYTR